MTVITHSVEETEKLAEVLAPSFGAATVIAMFGGLGAGKTSFVRGLAKGLHCVCSAVSPTYTIVNQYPGDRMLCHFDMYRLGSADALYEIGWEDYLASGALCAVEWSENIEQALPENAVRISFEVLGENTRRITIER